MQQLRQHAEQNNISIFEVILANEMAILGRTEDEVYAGSPSRSGSCPPQPIALPSAQVNVVGDSAWGAGQTKLTLKSVSVS